MKILRRTEDYGAVNVWVSIMALGVLLGMTGLALDAGYMVWTAEQLQVVADASAMAGARYCRNDEVHARDAALACAVANLAGGQFITLDRNDANALDGDVVIGRFDQDTGTFSTDVAGTNAVKVVARRTADSANGALELVFGRIFNLSHANIERDAIAMIGGGTGSGLLILSGDDRGALTIGGNTTLNVDGGAIQVNSSNKQALIVNGNVDTDAEFINIVGDYKLNGTSEADLPPIYTPSPEVPDPLAELLAPTWDPLNDLGTVAVHGESLILSPGFYSGGITLTVGSLVLQPGIYILDGAGLDITGGTFVAEGVMFYITGTGALDITGNGIVSIAPPDPELYSYPDVDTYEGIAIFQDRDNTTSAKIEGISTFSLEGTYYFPNNHLDIGGTGYEAGNQLIAHTMNIAGNSNLTINYDGRFKAPGNKVFLVL
jgi:hypothetical protein